MLNSIINKNKIPKKNIFPSRLRGASEKTVIPKMKDNIMVTKEIIEYKFIGKILLNSSEIFTVNNLI